MDSTLMAEKAISDYGPIEDVMLIQSILRAHQAKKHSLDRILVLEYGKGMLATSHGFQGVLVTEGSEDDFIAGPNLKIAPATASLPEFKIVSSLLIQTSCVDEQSKIFNGPCDKVDRISVLSIGEGDHTAAVIDWIDWTNFKPLLVRLDSGLVTETLEARIRDHDFRLTASSSSSNIYVYIEDSAKIVTDTHRPSIRTFDVFDTLIARRCVWPHGIFESMATAIGVPDFPALRKRAESEVYGDVYTLDDIYARLSDIAGLSHEEQITLRDIELRLEIQNVIPITENLAQVGTADILVSDMYLSVEQIRSLLKAAGFGKANQILVRSRGKHTGETWVDLNRHFEIKCHLGDNKHSDYDMALRHGVPARLTSSANFSPVEDALASKGFSLLACTMREARLRTHCDEPDVRRFQDLQTQINFPLLMIAGLHLAHVVAKHEYDVVLMASRDCNLWISLVEALAEMGRFAARPVYLHTNRNLLREPTPSYTRYVRAQSGERPLFVDLVGTGISALMFTHKTGISLPAYFIHDIVDSDYAVAEAGRLGVLRTPVAHRLSRKVGHNADLIEVINGDTCGTLRDVAEVGGTFMPRRDLPSLPAAALRRIHAMQEAFSACVRATMINGIDAAEDPAALEQVGGILLDLLHEQDGNILLEHHRQDEYARSGISSYKRN